MRIGIEGVQGGLAPCFDYATHDHYQTRSEGGLKEKSPQCLGLSLTVISSSSSSPNHFTRVHLRANVSSILTISLALVSMNPHPLLLDHSNPCLEVTLLSDFKSHLFPTTILTGIGFTSFLSSSPNSPPSPLRRLEFSSSRCSVSMSIISV